MAQRKELINLEEWLKKSIKTSIPTNAFVKSCNDYLREKILKKQKASDASVNVLSVEVRIGTRLGRTAHAPHAAPHASSSHTPPLLLSQAAAIFFGPPWRRRPPAALTEEISQPTSRASR